MFERFSSEARSIVVGAEQQAKELGDTHVGPQHFVLCIVDLADSLAVQTLTVLGVDVAAVRRELAVRSGPSDAGSATRLPFSPDGKMILATSLREALTLGDNRITAEHLLLAVLGQADSSAAQVLTRECDHGRIRASLLSALEAERGAPRSPARSRHGAVQPEFEVVTALQAERAKNPQAAPTHTHNSGSPEMSTAIWDKQVQKHNAQYQQPGRN